MRLLGLQLQFLRAPLYPLGPFAREPCLHEPVQLRLAHAVTHGCRIDVAIGVAEPLPHFRHAVSTRIIAATGIAPFAQPDFHLPHAGLEEIAAIDLCRQGLLQIRDALGFSGVSTRRECLWLVS